MTLITGCRCRQESAVNTCCFLPCCRCSSLFALFLSSFFIFLFSFLRSFKALLELVTQALQASCSRTVEYVTFKNRFLIISPYLESRFLLWWFFLFFFLSSFFLFFFTVTLKQVIATVVFHCVEESETNGYELASLKESSSTTSAQKQSLKK